MTEWTVKSNSFISLCSPWHFLLFMLFTVTLFLSFHIRGLMLVNGFVLFFFTLFRGVLSSPHLLVLSVCVCFIFLLCNFFLRRLHPVPWFHLKAESGDVVSKSSSNSPFMRVIMHNIHTWTFSLAGNGDGFQSKLDGPTLCSCPASQSPCGMLSQAFSCFKLHTSHVLKPALHLLPFFLTSYATR